MQTFNAKHLEQNLIPFGDAMNARLLSTVAVFLVLSSLQVGISIADDAVQPTPQKWEEAPLAERQSKTDAELVEALENYTIPWAAEELRYRCSKYSEEELRAVAKDMLHVGDTFGPGRSGQFGSYIIRLRRILPAQHYVPLAIELTSGKSLSARTVLISAFNRLDNALAAETLYDMYFEVKELEDQTRDPRYIDLCVQIRTTLETCGERGVELHTLLMGGTPEQAARNVQWSKMTLDEKLTTLVDECRRTGDIRRLNGYSYSLLPDDIQELVRRDVITRLEDTESENPSKSGIATAQANLDPNYLPYLEDIAANDPYCVVSNDDEIAAAMEQGYVVEPEYNAYPNRARAREAIHKIKEANYLYTRKQRVEYDLARAHQQIAQLEEHLAEGEARTGRPPDPDSLWARKLVWWQERAEKMSNEIAGIDALPEQDRLALEVEYREDVRRRYARALKEYQEREDKPFNLQHTTRKIAQLDSQIAELEARIAEVEADEPQ